jgi:endonuclease/exonuclease/phosphatase (EEP) superfamily protein YafD
MSEVVAVAVRERGEGGRDFRVDRLGRAMAWTGLVLSLAALVAGRLGVLIPALDLLAQFTGQLLAIAVVSTVTLLLRYQPMAVLIFGGFLAFAVHPVLALRAETPAAGVAATVTGTTWRVIALNTWHQHQDPAALVPFLAAERADVVLLSEFGPDKLELVHELARFYPYRFGCAGDWSCAIMILSRHPFTSAARSAPGETPRRAWITFGEGEQSLTVMAAHVHSPLDGARLHRRELDVLAGHIRALPGRVLIGGDFNATPWSASLSGFAAIGGLEHMGRLMPSWPAVGLLMPQLAIDHLFASPGIGFASLAIGPDVGSDHRPIMATVTLPHGLAVP